MTQRLVMCLWVACLWTLSFGARAELIFAEILANNSLLTTGEGPQPPSPLADFSLQDAAPIASYDWELVTFVDTNSLATGRTSVGEVRIVKGLTASSVRLRQAQLGNQVIDMTLTFLTRAEVPGQGQVLVEVYRIEGTNGRVTSIRPWADGTEESQLGLSFVEEVSFQFQSLTLTHLPSGTTTIIAPASAG